MKKFTCLLGLFISTFCYSQIAGTSFEEPAHASGKYTDTDDPTTAHVLINNPNEPLVNYVSTGNELSFQARYEPYNTPDVGSTDGDYVGVTKTKPHSTVPYTNGTKGYRMSDVDGNYILEFESVDLTGTNSPEVSLDFLLSINSNPTKGNYEGDGTINEGGHDRMRIYIKDLTNNSSVFLFDSTGTNLDEFVPYDQNQGVYLFQWQSVTASLLPNTEVQLVIEGRNNAKAESFWFDNIVFSESLSANEISPDIFSVYPNPTRLGHIFITSKSKEPMSITIIDVLGKTNMKTTLLGQKMDISNLVSGVYILKIEQDNNSVTKKLIVH